MNDSNVNTVPRRRWLAWQPNESISANAATTEPTKPSEPGFDGFDGCSRAQSAEIGITADELPPFRLKSTTPEVDSSTPTERVMSWAEWKADALNQLFLELGNSGQPGRIMAETIRRGERACMTTNRDIASQKSTRSE